MEDLVYRYVMSEITFNILGPPTLAVSDRSYEYKPYTIETFIRRKIKC